MEHSGTAYRATNTMARLGAAAGRLPWASLLVGGSLATIWLLFAAANLLSWQETHRPTGLGASLLELTAGIFFVFRRPARLTSRSLLAWVATAAATFGVLAARPGGAEPLGGLEPIYTTLQLVGFALALVSIGALGRSFGLVAANRGIVTRGPYRLVRHPLYSSYFLAQVGYLLENPTVRNWAVIVPAILFQAVRIHTEEECLAKDPEYAAYCRRVRWRLVPRVL